MIYWQRIVVSTQALVGDPGELPVHVQGLDAVTLMNLPAAFGADTLTQLDLLDTGFLPVELPAPPPPLVVSRMQLQRQLLREARTDGGDGSLLDEIEAAVAAQEATGTVQGRDLGLYWKETSEFHRDHPALLAFTAVLGITPERLGEIFAAAALLT